MTEPRERLLAERAETLRRLRDLDASFTDIVEAARDSNLDDEHDPEGSTIGAERSLVGSLAERARLQLNEIDAALARLGGGTYGVCTGCGEQIVEARLIARPSADLCVPCASRQDRPGRRR